jgi:hypothetical protein
MAMEFAEPSPTARFPQVAVLSAGILTSLATIALLPWLNATAPAGAIVEILFGAIVVGILAGSGYGLSSWRGGVRIGWGLLGVILVLQVACYFALQYLDFWTARAALPVGTTFWQHYDDITRAIAFEERGQPGPPLGEWGYVLRALEVVGFALGGLIPPAILRQRPHCNSCQRYMRIDSRWWLPASVPACDYESTEQQAWNEYLDEQAAAEARAMKLIAQLQAAITENDLDTCLELLGDNSRPSDVVAALPRRTVVALFHCHTCHGGRIVATSISGDGTSRKYGPAVAIDVPSGLLRPLLTDEEDSR